MRGFRPRRYRPRKKVQQKRQKVPAPKSSAVPGIMYPPPSPFQHYPPPPYQHPLQTGQFPPPPTGGQQKLYLPSSSPYQGQQPPPYNNQLPPYQPGQFQQPPYQQGQYPPPGFGGPPQPPFYPPAPPPHQYRGWTLAILAILYVTAVIMLVSDAAFMSGVSLSSDPSTSSSDSLGVVGNVGVFLIIAINIFIIIKDRHSFFSLFGRFRWQRINVVLGIFLGMLYFCALFMPPAYLVIAIQHHLRTSRQTLRTSLQSGWQGYRAKGCTLQLGIALFSVFLVLSFTLFTIFGAMADRANALRLLTPTVPTATSTSALVAVDTSVPTTDTSTPTPTPTPKPTPTPTPKPTPKPTQPPPPSLFITFTCASAVDYSYGQVCVHTEPGAALTITVTYCSGYDATSGSLQGTVYANGSGNYTWYWTPETKCRGHATAFVTADWNGQSTSNSDGFTVQ